MVLHDDVPSSEIELKKLTYWVQRDSNSQLLSLQTNNEPYSQTGNFRLKFHLIHAKDMTETYSTLLDFTCHLIGETNSLLNYHVSILPSYKGANLTEPLPPPPPLKKLRRTKYPRKNVPKTSRCLAPSCDPKSFLIQIQVRNSEK